MAEKNKSKIINTTHMDRLANWGKTVHMSRSGARRVLSNIEKFKKITLDFDGVPTIGQAFADEVFRVFLSNHPEITIEPINMNETVRFMIGRVEKVQPELFK